LVKDEGGRRRVRRKGGVNLEREVVFAGFTWGGEGKRAFGGKGGGGGKIGCGENLGCSLTWGEGGALKKGGGAHYEGERSKLMGGGGGVGD